jgi:hypothetical protein
MRKTVEIQPLIAVRELQYETFECTMVNTKGKLEVIDKNRLANLHGEIEDNQALIKRNSQILNDLEKILGTNGFQSVLQLENAV